MFTSFIITTVVVNAFLSDVHSSLTLVVKITMIGILVISVTEHLVMFTIFSSDVTTLSGEYHYFV